jgi:inner membrane protein involved in colicin E2 resistance
MSESTIRSLIRKNSDDTVTEDFQPSTNRAILISILFITIGILVFFLYRCKFPITVPAVAAE